MPEEDRAPLIAALLRVPYQTLLARVLRRLRAEYPDLRPAHLTVLQVIDHPPGGTRLTDLAGRAEMTMQSMGELVDGLERRGYLERLPDPHDRRAKLIRMTQRGWDVHERGYAIVAEIQAAWSAELGATAFDELLARLRDLNATLRGDLHAP